MLLIGPLSARGWATVRPENRVGGSPGFSSTFVSPSASQGVESHQENPACVYDFASGVGIYLYAHSNPVNNIDPSGHFSMNESLATIKTVSFLSARVAVGVTRAYFTATSVLDAIDTVQGITQAIRNGDLIRSVKDLISGLQQQSGWNFTIGDVEQSIEDNIDDVIRTGLGAWAKGFQKAILKGDRVDSILIYAPTPVAGMPFSTVPTGIRWRGIQVELAVGDPGQRDTRIMGVGLKMTKQPYPQNLHQLWRMDAGPAHRQNKPHEIAIIDDPPHFHYHVNQW